MQIYHHVPKFPLSGYIQHMVYVQGALPLPYIKELPQGGINIVIELNEDTVNTVYPEKKTESGIEMRHAWISGMQKQGILYKNNINSTIISIRFTIGGFYALTRIPITTIKHVGIEAEAILGNSFKKLYQELLNTPVMAEKFALIESYFLEYTVKESVEQHIVRFTHQHLDKTVDWIVQKSGYSQKHLIHLLKKHTGFSPKYLSRINRFHQVANEIQRHKQKIDWFFVVQRYGYFDQAHLIKEFTHFSGISPTEYLISQIALEKNSELPDMILQLPAKKKKSR